MSPFFLFFPFVSNLLWPRNTDCAFWQHSYTVLTYKLRVEMKNALSGSRQREQHNRLKSSQMLVAMQFTLSCDTTDGALNLFYESKSWSVFLRYWRCPAIYTKKVYWGIIAIKCCHRNNMIHPLSLYKLRLCVRMLWCNLACQLCRFGSKMP